MFKIIIINNIKLKIIKNFFLYIIIIISVIKIKVKLKLTFFKFITIF